MINLKTFLGFLSVLVNYCVCYNILMIYPYYGKSHFLVFQPMLKLLAHKGHNLTVISHFPQKEPVANYRDISLSNISEPSGVEVIQMDHLINSRLGLYYEPFWIAKDARCQSDLSNNALQNFVKEGNKFDVILIEFFNTNCFMGIANKYKAPVIGLSSSVGLPWVADWFGNPNNPSYIPVIYMDYSDHMTFFERLENTLVLVFSKFVYKYAMDNPGNEHSKKYLGEDLHEGEDIMYNVSLFLTNSHFSLNKAKPLVPNYIEVGGLHVEKPKTLPMNIEKWINESTDGVIYFSLGSMIKGHTFPKEKREAFTKAFGRLPQRVLWKWENKTMEGKPDNVMIQKWMPQLDILCHPNVKAFISHGGLLGTTEAVHCGVPVIVMPQFGDQHTNARALEASGGGVILQLSEATEDKVYKALKKVLSSDFRQKAKELSERFRDRPLPPLETAIYWVEYVARHRGAPHMKTAAVNMPFYKYYLLDVIAFLLFIVSLFIYIVYFVISFIFRRLFKRSEKVKMS